MAYNNKPTAYNDGTTAYNDKPTAYNNKTTAYNDKPIAYNDGTTAYNDKPTAYNDGTTAFNNKPTAYNDGTKAYNKYYHIRQLWRSMVLHLLKLIYYDKYLVFYTPFKDRVQSYASFRNDEYVYMHLRTR